jgi:hypothetical protein
MVMPTRFIDKAEFDELMKVEGSTVIPAYRLDGVPFQPPFPGEKWQGEKYKGINILLLNVVEPVLYKDGRGNAYIILNENFDDQWDYEYFAEFHPAKHDAWFYRLCPIYWKAGDIDYNLRDAKVFYNHGEEEDV